MVETQGYRARVRFRMPKRLASEASDRLLMVCGREVQIKPEEKGKLFNDSEWLILIAKGFETENDARLFGERLTTVVDATGMILMAGVDPGLSKATSWISEDFVRAMGLIEPHEILIQNIHGVSVYPDSDDVRIPVIRADGEVRQDADLFFDTLREVGERFPATLGAAATGIRLINMALLSGHPLAQLILVISAVEALGQSEKWTPEQRAVLDGLAKEVPVSSGLPSEQAEEVARAIRNGMHRIGLRQGVLRVLKKLDLMELKAEWDRIYGLRSHIVHGAQMLPQAEMDALANDAMKLCGRIVMTLLLRDGVVPPIIYFAQYEVPST